jgi:hypothetical protein
MPPIARSPKPKMLQVIPPNIPRFAISVVSAKRANVEGRPIPTDKPKSIERMKFTNKALFGIVVKVIDIIAPKTIHKTRPVFFARGKSHPPKKAETAIAAKKAPNNKIFAANSSIRLLKSEKVEVNQIRLLATIINEGANSRHLIPLKMLIIPNLILSGLLMINEVQHITFIDSPYCISVLQKMLSSRYVLHIYRGERKMKAKKTIPVRTAPL